MAARAQAISKGPALKRQAWKDLGSHFKEIREVHLRQLFADDPKRGQHLTAEVRVFISIIRRIASPLKHSSS